jgi:hypothetical protein
MHRSLIAAATLLVAAPAAAAMLDADTCKGLKTEQGQLDQRGARVALTGGPATAARLSGQQVQDVKRLIEVDELLTFRCPLPPAPKPPQAQAKASDGKTDDAPKAAPKPKPKPVPIPEDASSGEPKATPKPAPKAKSASKADDAYRPQQ